MEGGAQIMQADNGDQAGFIYYADEKIFFDFDQGWSLTGEQPEVVIYGFSEPGGAGELLYSELALFHRTELKYYATVSNFPYYSVELKAQYCTTGN